MPRLALFLCLILPLGCDRGQARPPTTSSTSAPAASIRIVISGDTDGWLTPCGCTSNQSGGLLRRATYLKQVESRGAPVIYVDAGGAAAGTSEYQKTKFEAIARGEQLMQVAAHNIGGSEAAPGPEYLRELKTRIGLPLISANARDADDKSIAEPAVVVNAGGVRIAIVGVLSSKFATPQLHIADPRQTIAQAIAPLAGKYDALIVLAYLPDEELQQLAGNLPEADAVIGGPTGQAIAPRSMGPTLLASATNKGKFVIELAGTRGARGEGGANGSGRPTLSGSVVELNTGYKDDPAQLDNVKQYLATLAAKDFPADETGLVQPLPAGAPPDYRIAGSASCASCHAGAQTVWEHSKHAHALLTLRDKAFDVDPSCQQCHTTGYGLPGGFVSPRRSGETLGGVGCENCHGPSLAHVKNPRLHTPFAAADQCIRCHDRENSPTFAYMPYWAKIKHARETSGNR